MTQGKNAQKKALNAAAGKTGGNEEVVRTLKDPKFRVLDPSQKAVPPDWRDMRNVFFVFARCNNMPADLLERFKLWAFALELPKIFPGYVPSNELQEAAKGINVWDLMFRAAIMPLGAFMTLEEANDMVKKASDYFECSVQTIKFYDWAVVPPFTSKGVTYGDEEVATFMKQYAREGRMNQEAFANRKDILAKESQAINDRAARGELVADPTLGGLLKVESIMGFHALPQGVLSEEGQSEAATTTQEGTAVSAVTSWTQEVNSSTGGIVGQRAKLITLMSDVENTLHLYKRQIDALHDRNATLTETLEKMRAMNADFVKKQRDLTASSVINDSNDSTTTVTTAATATKERRTKVKMVIKDPSGRWFKVLLDGRVQNFAPGETEADFEVEVVVQQPREESEPEQPETVQTTIIDDGAGFTPLPHGAAMLMTAQERMAAYNQVAANPHLLSDAARRVADPGEGRFYGQMQDAQDLLAEHNARRLAMTPEQQAAELEELEASQQASQAEALRLRREQIEKMSEC
jgi:hypothetical protein